MRKHIIISALIISGCGTNSPYPKFPEVKKPDYVIYQLSEDATNSEKAKSIVISWNQCRSYSSQLENIITAAQ